MKTRLLAVALVLTLSTTALAQSRLATGKAPELEGGLGWLNTDKPIKIEELKGQIAESKRVIFTAPNNGEVERLGDIFAEYSVPFRLGSRATTTSGETYLEETQYFGGELSAVTVVKAAVPEGVVLPEASLTIFGAHDLFEESEVVVKRPLRQKSKTSAFLSDFRDLAVGDLSELQI